jgi:hypothetical protein
MGGKSEGRGRKSMKGVKKSSWEGQQWIFSTGERGRVKGMIVGMRR